MAAPALDYDQDNGVLSLHWRAEKDGLMLLITNSGEILWSRHEGAVTFGMNETPVSIPHELSVRLARFMTAL